MPSVPPSEPPSEPPSPPPQPGRNRAIPAAAPSPPIVLSASRRFIMARSIPKSSGGRRDDGHALQEARDPADPDPEADRGADARGDRDDQDAGDGIAPEPAEGLDVVGEPLAIGHAGPAAPCLDHADHHAGAEQRMD